MPCWPQVDYQTPSGKQCAPLVTAAAAAWLVQVSLETLKYPCQQILGLWSSGNGLDLGAFLCNLCGGGHIGIFYYYDYILEEIPLHSGTLAIVCQQLRLAQYGGKY